MTKTQTKIIMLINNEIFVQRRQVSNTKRYFTFFFFSNESFLFLFFIITVFVLNFTDQGSSSMTIHDPQQPSYLLSLQEILRLQSSLARMYTVRIKSRTSKVLHSLV